MSKTKMYKRKHHRARREDKQKERDAERLRRRAGDELLAESGKRVDDMLEGTGEYR